MLMYLQVVFIKRNIKLKSPSFLGTFLLTSIVVQFTFLCCFCQHYLNVVQFHKCSKLNSCYTRRRHFISVLYCLVPRCFLGFSEQSWCKGSWEKLEALSFTHEAYHCAFAFLKLSHDPCATTTFEKPKKRLGTRQLSLWNLDLASFRKFLRLSLARV